MAEHEEITKAAINIRKTRSRSKSWPFWQALADFLEGEARQLEAADGIHARCDEPGAISHALHIAREYNRVHVIRNRSQAIPSSQVGDR